MSKRNEIYCSKIDRRRNHVQTTNRAQRQRRSSNSSKTIENKREEETKRAELIEEEKAAKRAELPRFETIPPLDPEAVQKRNNLEKQLMSYFKGISVSNKMNILDLVCVYEDAEEMLQFARQIYKENHGKSMGYIIKILRNWQKNNVQNLTDAKQFQKTNFGTKDKSDNKANSKKKVMTQLGLTPTT